MIPLKIKEEGQKCFSPEGVDTTKPTETDVLFGRCKLCFNHIGNIRFRLVIQGRVKEYEHAPTRRDKSRIVYSVVQHVSNYGGRFLKKAPKASSTTGNNSNGNSNGNGETVWRTVSVTEAIQKVGHALRDKKQHETRAKGKPLKVAKNNSVERNCNLLLQLGEVCAKEVQMNTAPSLSHVLPSLHKINNINNVIDTDTNTSTHTNTNTKIKDKNTTNSDSHNKTRIAQSHPSSTLLPTSKQKHVSLSSATIPATVNTQTKTQTQPSYKRRMSSEEESCAQAILEIRRTLVDCCPQPSSLTRTSLKLIPPEEPSVSANNKHNYHHRHQVTTTPSGRNRCHSDENDHHNTPAATHYGGNNKVRRSPCSTINHDTHVAATVTNTIMHHSDKLRENQAREEGNSSVVTPSTMSTNSNSSSGSTTPEHHLFHVYSTKSIPMIPSTVLRAQDHLACG
mmetsp:Transcript_16261/g.23609  ORF Transcript_16261/g.23609 Transcript_16261/m.23609 type:complete len:451 (+) Transcript_16261:17-1369(+)